MPTIHDFTKEARTLDRSQVGLSVALLKEQILHTERTFPARLALPKKKWDSVVLCGMGGSALGADVLRALYAEYLTVPFVIVHGYALPKYVSQKDLVILCSYSGTTEEVLSCLAEARSRKCTTFIIAQGGPLIAAAKRFHIPHYAFTAEHNPSKQPRIGTGYTMTAVYMLLHKLKLIAKGAPDYLQAARHMTIDSAVPNRFAVSIKDQSCIIIAAEHLRGVAHVFSNQLNESAKVFAPYYTISELNHHLLEGLGSLRSARRHWTIIFLESKQYSLRIKKRFAVTRKVMEKQGFKTRSISFTGTTASECLKMISFTSFTTYYLALLGKKNPAAIPWVDYFKKALG